MQGSTGLSKGRGFFQVFALYADFMFLCKYYTTLPKQVFSLITETISLAHVEPFQLKYAISLLSSLDAAEISSYLPEV